VTDTRMIEQKLSRRDDGTDEVHRVDCAVDCGLAVNPDPSQPRWRAASSTV
jgi:hypothetical protein